MKITVKSKDNKNISLLLPTRLLLNDLTAVIVTNIANKHIPKESNIKLKTRDMRNLIKELIRTKKRYPHLHIVDVESADGDIVKIKL